MRRAPPPFDERALFRVYPRLAGRIPWLPLGSAPTPVEPLHPGIAATGRQLWIKRDDLTGGPYGGNKVRKLEHLIAAAVESGTRRVITAGAFGSHHALATTVYAMQFGLRVTCVLFPQRVTPHVRSILRAMRGAGADLHFVPRMEAVPLGVRAARRAAAAERPFVIPPGGSDALGTMGYVGAALELAEQIRAGHAPEGLEVVVAAGTLGTAAGIALGLTAAGVRARVRAVRITSRLVTNRRALRRLVRGASRILRGAGYDPPRERLVMRGVVLDHAEVGAGYGRVTPAALGAIDAFREWAIALDPTYTAKAGAAALAPCGDTPRLYWHTLSAHEVPPTGLAPEEELPAPFREVLRAADLASRAEPG